ncbi:peptidoglycan-associated lipoprotein [Alphaproteobacteria bacterium]|nr:peptidoglycan-associated lipoprotein [Alphaproteobacteria bacterium]
MEKIVVGLLSFAGLVFLTGCECSKDDECSGGGKRGGASVVSDESLRDSAANFIANAGDRVFFAYDKSNVSQEAEATLGRQAEWLKNNSSKKVLIEGHCDTRGTREYNIGLGERRADAAAHYLINQGISGARVRTISYGKDRPIAVQGTNEEIHRMNRVAISVIE